MNCISCKDNYLRKLFERCFYVCERDINKTLIFFISECAKVGDERTSLSIFNAMIDGPDSCDECKKYREMYKAHFNDLI